MTKVRTPTRVCNSCGKEKLVIYFDIAERCFGRHMNTCQACRSELKKNKGKLDVAAEMRKWK